MIRRQSLQQRGLTLLEVLIASVILFTAVTVASEAYRTNLLATLKASDTATILTPVPLIVEQVRQELRARPEERVEGRGEALGVVFEFSAETVAFAPPPRRFDPDTAEFRTYEPRFRLYAVTLSLRRGLRQRQFSYRELAWSAELK